MKISFLINVKEINLSFVPNIVNSTQLKTKKKQHTHCCITSGYFNTIVKMMPSEMLDDFVDIDFKLKKSNKDVSWTKPILAEEGFIYRLLQKLKSLVFISQVALYSK